MKDRLWGVTQLKSQRVMNCNEDDLGRKNISCSLYVNRQCFVYYLHTQHMCTECFYRQALLCSLSGMERTSGEKKHIKLKLFIILVILT